jgi:hypothetical protein
VCTISNGKFEASALQAGFYHKCVLTYFGIMQYIIIIITITPQLGSTPQPSGLGVDPEMIGLATSGIDIVLRNRVKH